MSKIVIIFALVSTPTIFCHGQQIEEQKVFGGYKYYQNGNQLRIRDLIRTMQSAPDALSLMKEARANNVVATIIGGAGGFLIGWPLGTAIGGGSPKWSLAGIGLGLVVVSIPFTSIENKKTKQAVDLYNNSLDTSSSSKRMLLGLVVDHNGIGISLRF